MSSYKLFSQASLGLFAGLFLLVGVVPAGAEIYMIEPDDYPTWTDISHPNDCIWLRIYDSDSGTFDSPAVTPIVAIEDNHTSTGSRVFSRNGISSFSDTRQLDMLFMFPTDFVSIDFIGSSSIENETGILEIYDSLGTLLDTYTTAALGDNEVETMSFTRPGQDIKSARAYTAAGPLTLGRLDNLKYKCDVPEPATLAIVTLAGLFMYGTRRRKLD